MYPLSKKSNNPPGRFSVDHSGSQHAVAIMMLTKKRISQFNKKKFDQWSDFQYIIALAQKTADPALIIHYTIEAGNNIEYKM